MQVSCTAPSPTDSSQRVVRASRRRPASSSPGSDMSDSSTTSGKQRLLFISRKWPPAIGGMETYSVELATSLGERFEVDTLVLPGKPSGAPPSLFSYGAFVLKALFRCVAKGRRYPFVIFGDPLLFPAALAHYLVARASRRFVVVYGLDLVYGTRPGV